MPSIQFEYYALEREMPTLLVTGIDISERDFSRLRREIGRGYERFCAEKQGEFRLDFPLSKLRRGAVFSYEALDNPENLRAPRIVFSLVTKSNNINDDENDISDNPPSGTPAEALDWCRFVDNQLEELSEYAANGTINDPKKHLFAVYNDTNQNIAQTLEGDYLYRRAMVGIIVEAMSQYRRGAPELGAYELALRALGDTDARLARVPDFVHTRKALQWVLQKCHLS